MNAVLRIKIKRKHYLFRLHKNGAISFDKYNSFKLSTEKDLKFARCNYYKQKFAACNGDSGDTWKLTRSLLRGNQPLHSEISIIDNNRVIED